MATFVCNAGISFSVSSPDGSFELEEPLGGLDHPDVIARQDAGAQEEAHVPVALQLVQAAFFAQQAAQLHSWKTRWGGGGQSFPPLAGRKHSTINSRHGNLNENGSYGIWVVGFGSEDLRGKNRRQGAGFWSRQPGILGLKRPRRRLNGVFAGKTGAASAQFACGDESQRLEQVQRRARARARSSNTAAVLRGKTPGGNLSGSVSSHEWLMTLVAPPTPRPGDL